MEIKLLLKSVFSNLLFQGKKKKKKEKKRKGCICSADTKLIENTFGVHPSFLLTIIDLTPFCFLFTCASVSNLGMFGISSFTAIINPPQAAILAVGRSTVRYGEGGSPRTVLSATLCFDSRVITQEAAGRWLEVFSGALSAPELFL